MTVYKAGVWSNIYIGDAVKAGSLPFFPVQPNDVQKEPEDPVEEYEPHPKEAPKGSGEGSEEEPSEDEDQG